MCSILERADEAEARDRATHGQFLEVVAELLGSDAWRGDGARDLASWMAARWQKSYRQASQDVRDAKALNERRALSAALSAGEVSIDQCKALQVLCEEGTDDDEVWLEALPFWSLPELEREARKKIARELERRDDGVYFRTRHTKDERYVRGVFQLHPEQGAAVIAAVDGLIPLETKFRDLDHAAALAFVELAKGGGAPPTVVLAVDDPHDVASLSSGGFVSAETAGRLGCDARVQVVGIDGVTMGKTSRTISPAMRRAVEVRDGGMCVYPGCEMDRFLECHHIVPVAKAGPTTLENLVLVCWRHHGLVHEERWGLAGEAGPNITWLRPDGSIFEPRVRVTLDTS